MDGELHNKLDSMGVPRDVWIGTNSVMDRLEWLKRRKAMLEANGTRKALAKVRERCELDSLDARIKIAFAEMWLAWHNGPTTEIKAEMHRVQTDFYYGERTESLLAEMQQLTKEMTR